MIITSHLGRKVHTNVKNVVIYMVTGAWMGAERMVYGVKPANLHNFLHYGLKKLSMQNHSPPNVTTFASNVNGVILA